MKRLRLSDLKGPFRAHVLESLVDGEWLSGGMSLKEPGARTHDAGCRCPSCDGAGRHRHDDAEIFIFLAGEAALEVDGKEYKAVPGDVFVVEPGEDHHVRAEGWCLNLWLHGAARPG